jgi:hypothetical protein
MPQDQTVVVEIPGVGNVEFPASMSQTDIARAAAKLHAEAGARPDFSNVESGSSSAVEQPGAVSRFASGAARTLLPSTTPSDYVTGPLYAARHPIDSLNLLWESIKGAHVDQARKTSESAGRISSAPTLGGKAGAISETLGHGLATVLPVVGPAAAAAGEAIGSGDVAGGLGMTAGLLAPSAAARLRSKVSVPVVPAVARNKNQKLAAAVSLAEREGVPVDAATATGKPFIQTLQKAASDRPGGSGIADRFRAEQSAKLATVGEQLASKVRPGRAISPEKAGQGLRDAVHEKVGQYHGKANAAYEQLREMEADPSNARVIEPEVPPVNPDAPAHFTSKVGAKPNDIFLSALADAKRNGFKGSPAELKVAFDDKVTSAKSLIQDMKQGASEQAPTQLLKDIRKYGGLRTFEKEQWHGREGVKRPNGDLQSIVEGFASKYSGRNQRGGSSIFRENGLSLDGMLEALRQDPKWQFLESTNDLLDALDEISRAPDDGAGYRVPDLEEALRQTGVEPGTKWWEPRKEPITVQAPVDLRNAKAALRPVYDRMKRQLPLTQQQASPGLKALENIINGPDHAPLSQVDADLSAIKSISRGKRGDLPELRDVSQGLAAEAVKQLDAAVQQTAGSMGPAAESALHAGRKATISKYKAGDVLKQMREEPVQVFQQATYAKDAGVAHLRRVAALAPQELPKVGRAYLDDLMREATADGGFDKAKTLATRWDSLGPQTKRLLFKDPAYITDLDNFFRLARKIAENPNPSGTARVNNVFNAATALPSYAIAKMLYSRKGIKILTNGIRVDVPVGGPRAGLAGRASAGRPQPQSAQKDDRKKSDVYMTIR